MTKSQTISELEQQLAECERVMPVDVHKKIDVLNDLAWALSDTDLHRAYELGKRAFSLATSPDNSAPPYQAGQGHGLRTMGYINQRLGDYPTGLEQLLQALQLLEGLPSDGGLADVYDGIAGIHFQIGNFPEALDMAYKQLKTAESIQDPQRIANAYNNLAALHFETGDPERSKEMHKRNLELAREIGYARIECLAYINLAENNLIVGENEAAVENGLRGLQLSREHGYDMFEIYALHMIGRAYQKQQCYDQALARLEEATNRSHAFGTKVTESLSLLHMGDVLREMRQIERAKECLNRAVAISREIEGSKEEYVSLLILSEIFEQEGDSTQALDYFKQYQSVKERFAGDKADLRLKVLKVTHDTETAQREAEIAHLRTVELQQEVAESGRARLLLQRQLNYVQALAECSRTLLQVAESTASQKHVLEQALEHLRVGSQSSRAYVYRNFEDPDLGPCLGIMAEASAPDIHTHDRPENRKAPWTRMPSAVFEALQAGKPIGGPVETLFADLPDELAAYRRQSEPLLSILCVPVFLGNRWWGFVGFDDCVEVRQWEDEEIRMLTTAAGMMANTLQRWQTEQLVMRQFRFSQALSAFKQELLASAGTEADRGRILTQAVIHLLEATQALTIALHQNFDDPEFGPSGRLLAVAGTTSLSPDDDRNWPTVQEAFRQLLERQMPAAEVRSEEFISAVFPWAIVPPEMTQQLAAGQWVGGPISDLYAGALAYVGLLLGDHRHHALLVYPIERDGDWWGTISVIRRRTERTQATDNATLFKLNVYSNARWADDEILLFGAAVKMIASTIQRWQIEAELHALNNLLEQKVQTRTAELSNTVALLQTEIEERKRAEAALQNLTDSLEHHLIARTEELAAFFDLSILAGRRVNLPEIFAGILPRIMEITRSEGVFVDLIDPESMTLNLTGQVNLPEDIEARIKISDMPLFFQQWLAQAGDPLLIPNLAKSLPEYTTFFRTSEFQTYLGAQIRIGNQIEGVLQCLRSDPGGYSVDEVALVSALSQQLGMMLEIDRLRQQTRNLAVLEERERLARDLHDSVTQSLYSLSLFSRAGREAAEDGDTDRLQQVFAELEGITVLILRELRLMLYDLRPMVLGEGTLTQAIEYRLNTVERRASLQLDVKMDDLVGLSHGQEGDLFYIILEGMNNVVRHALARRATLFLTQENGNIRLMIADDGQGFDPRQSGGGLGLRNMRERVESLGGKLTIASEPGHGTRLEVTIPID